MVFEPKFQNFFFQLNEMRDEAKPLRLFSGLDGASSYFSEENPCLTRTLIRVPHLLTISVK